MSPTSSAQQVWAQRCEPNIVSLQLWVMWTQFWHIVFFKHRLTHSQTLTNPYCRFELKNKILNKIIIIWISRPARLKRGNESINHVCMRTASRALQQMRPSDTYLRVSAAENRHPPSEASCHDRSLIEVRYYYSNPSWLNVQADIGGGHSNCTTAAHSSHVRRYHFGCRFKCARLSRCWKPGAQVALNCEQYHLHHSTR